MARSHKDEFTKAVKIAAFQRCGGLCECGCGVKIIAGDGPEYDHRIPVALGGDNSLENCLVKRRTCHKKKSIEQAPVIAKSKRIAEKNMGLRKTSRPMLGSKASGWKKPFNGPAERR